MAKKICNDCPDKSKDIEIKEIEERKEKKYSFPSLGKIVTAKDYSEALEKVKAIQETAKK